MIPFLAPLLAGAAPAPAVVPAQPAPIVRQAAAANGTAPTRTPAPSSRSSGGGGAFIFGGNINVAPVSIGCPPDVWGRSRACARMVRKNARQAKHHRGAV